jgi:hypothetical protein
LILDEAAGKLTIYLAFPQPIEYCDRPYGLVITVPGYRSRGLGFDSRHYKILLEVVGLERGPLNLVRITEELFQGNMGSGLENRD